MLQIVPLSLVFLTSSFILIFSTVFDAGKASAEDNTLAAAEGENESSIENDGADPVDGDEQAEDEDEDEDELVSDEPSDDSDEPVDNTEKGKASAQNSINILQ